MKEIVRSIKPYWFFLICEGIKKAELGKDKPKDPDWNRVVNLYCSKDKKSFDRIPKEFKEKYRNYLGKIGARFICDRLEDFSKSIINTVNCYELQTMHDIYTKTCVTQDELCKYLNEREENKPFYIWNVSKLTVHNKPIELYNFFNYNKYKVCKELNCFSGDCWRCANNAIMTRPPQSWCYVEEINIYD